MNIYPNVTQEHLGILRKSAEEQKDQRAPKIKNRKLKQTPDIKLAESLSPITEKLEEKKNLRKNKEKDLGNQRMKMKTLNYQLYKIR